MTARTLPATEVRGATKRIVICEDSRTYATALRRALEHDGTCSVVGVFETAERALAALPDLRPDLVTMDLALPGMSGLQAVEQIMSSLPVPILVLSAHLEGGASVAALAAGALETLPKTQVDLTNPEGPGAQALRRRAAVLSGARVIRHPRGRLTGRAAPRPISRRRRAMIGVCASTGGPQALANLLGGLPLSFPIPIVIVQHIAAGFTEGLAKLLDQTVELPVQLAREGLEPRNGVFLAPEGAHLTIGASSRFAFDRDTVAGVHRPSGDVLLESMAENLGGDAIAVVLTGMGRDGARGIRAVRDAGGLTIAQDERSSAIFGMPKAAIDAGAEIVLALNEMPARLMRLATGLPR